MFQKYCDAIDTLKAVRSSYYQGNGATLDEVRAAAVAVLEIKQQGEKARFGKIKTKITPVAIASLIRG